MIPKRHLFVSVLMTLAACGSSHPQVDISPEEALSTQNFCMVTHYSKGGEDYSEIAIANQTQYARRHGYSHDAFKGHISGDAFIDPAGGTLDDIKGGGLFWQKYAAIQILFKQTVANKNTIRKRCDWVVWMDSDAIITNQLQTFPDIIKSALRNADGVYEDKDIILAREQTHLLNSGVIFVRNTESGNAFIEAASAMYPLFKDADLPDQIAISNLVFLAEPYSWRTSGYDLKERVHPQAAVAPQRLFNAFTLGTTEEVKWQVGDFVAHLAGVGHDQRAEVMHEVLAESAAHNLL